MNQTLFVIGCDVGIGKFPNTYECCARTYCQAPNGTAGVCVNSADCTGEKFTTANGAVGCYLHKAAVTCCVGGVNPTVAPVDVVEPFTAPPEGTTVADGGETTTTTDDGGLLPTMTRTKPWGGDAATTTASLALVVLIGVATTAL
jgi:hypothetical protein